MAEEAIRSATTLTQRAAASDGCALAYSLLAADEDLHGHALVSHQRPSARALALTHIGGAQLKWSMALDACAGELEGAWQGAHDCASGEARILATMEKALQVPLPASAVAHGQRFAQPSL